MDLSPKLIFVIALMMVATYSCNAIIFPEDTTDYLGNYDQFAGSTGKDITFQVWLDLNFDMAYQHIFNGIQIDNRFSYSAITYTYIKQNYDDSMIGWDKSHQGIFDTFNYNSEGAGWRWYNSEWVKGIGLLEWITGTTKTGRINDDYHKYLQDIGVEEIPKGNLMDTIVVLFVNVWEGFTQLLRLLTFTNIPNCPLWVTGMLNVFFIPMWIVLMVGIAPYAMKMIKAISDMIEPWIPW